MSKTVRIWFFSAVAILITVIAGYYSFQETDSSRIHEHNEDSLDHHQEESNRHDHHGQHAGSTIDVDVTYAGETIKISVINEDGDIPELAITHEKFMHLILISNDLETFIHLHPEQTEEGQFVVDYPLDHTSYQVFVDIDPVNESYETKPISLNRTDQAHLHSHLSIDDEKIKEIAGTEVELQVAAVKTGEPVDLSFDVKNAVPEPYLGALGHVVIVDEHLSTFIHVHPESAEDTIFKAHFQQPGIYKIWAEFKVDGEVHVFPFIIEVE
jgi:ABC-type nickel/cobalt efflux system permease component RcnA